MGLPTPEPGLVLNYAYLWHHEHRAGGGAQEPPERHCSLRDPCGG